MQPLRILETSLYAEDLGESGNFYGGVLGLELIAKEQGRHVFFRCGGSVLLVFNPKSTQQSAPGHLPPHGCAGAGHAAFAVEPEDLAVWRARLRRAGVAIERELRWPNGGESIYFRDPAGNSLEFATPALWGMAGQAV